MALGRAEQRSIVAKVRVYELAKEFGVESKAVMAELEKMGEFVRSASSTIEAPVVRRLKEAFAGDSGKPGRQGQRSGAGQQRRAQGGPGGAPVPAPPGGKAGQGGQPGGGQPRPAAPNGAGRGPVPVPGAGAQGGASGRPVPRP